MIIFKNNIQLCLTNKMLFFEFHFINPIASLYIKKILHNIPEEPSLFFSSLIGSNSIKEWLQEYQLQNIEEFELEIREIMQEVALAGFKLFSQRIKRSPIHDFCTITAFLMLRPGI
jgi:hypothetical protein